MKNIVINGINGKMGKAVYAAAAERKDFNVVCGVDKRAIGNFIRPADCQQHMAGVKRA